MAKAKKKKVLKQKLNDEERHARFVETARKVHASEDPEDFDMAFKKVVLDKGTKLPSPMPPKKK